MTATEPSAGRARQVLFTALVVLVALLAPVALAASWVRDTVFDTERYVSTVAPLATDPTIQSAVAEAASQAALDRLAATGGGAKAQDALTSIGVPDEVAEALLAPVRGQVQQVVTKTVDRVVTSEQFVDAWVASNRQAHRALAALLRGEDAGDVVVVDGATVGIALGPVTEAIEAELVKAGVPLADRIPPVAVSVPIVSVDALPAVQRGSRILDIVGRWLPVTVVILFAGAVLAAVRRARGLTIAATAVLASLTLVGLGLVLLRSWVVAGAGGAGTASGDLVSITLTQLLSPLRASARWSALLLVALAALGWILGDAPAAARSRDRLAALGRRDGVRRPLSPLAKARTSIVLAAALVIALWDEPSGAVLLLVVVAALVGMVWAEVLLGRGRSAPSGEPPAATDP